MEIRKVSIVGMGALGLLYGTYIYDNIGKDAVTFIMDDARLERYKNRNFTVNGRAMDFSMASAKDARPCDLLIVAVKYNAIPSAIEVMKNCIGENTIIISVLNGISSESLIAKRYGDKNILYSIAQGMDAMRFGDDLKFVSPGNLLIGTPDEKKKHMLRSLTDFLEKAKIPHILPEDILHAMWRKYLLNVGVNQACMVYDTGYGGVLEEGEPNLVMIGAMREVIAVGNAEGIRLTEEDLNFAIDIEKALPPESVPSMAQDRIQKNPSEVEMFAGTVIKLAEKHNIHVPANRYLYKRVKEIEAEY